ncbi:hypothetical protein DPMN_157766 [Dreissena polymorpha]|uniref:Uncharacterized protein n=1 Tax=Dreissena polymorpha TaxID=45954 RepID=A0A9D4EL53_DREPO|nr:hypothetical protein DPMN_157766 [Dreissena polymorpha]
MLLKYPKFHVSLTMNRKRLTGVARGNDTERALEMASYMKHNLSAADKHYAVQQQL